MPTLWTAPRTWTVGEQVTKNIMDTHVRDNENYLKEHIDTLETKIVIVESIPPLTIESAILPITDASATIQQKESTAVSPKANWLEGVFSSGTNSHLHWKRFLPLQTGTVAIVRIHGYMETGTSGNIGFGAQISSLSDGENVTAQAFGTTNIASEGVPGTAKTKFVLDIPITNTDAWAPGDEVIIDVYRNTAVASNAAGNCMMTGGQLLFTS